MQVMVVGQDQRSLSALVVVDMDELAKALSQSLPHNTYLASPVEATSQLCADVQTQIHTAGVTKLMCMNVDDNPDARQLVREAMDRAGQNLRPVERVTQVRC